MIGDCVVKRLDDGRLSVTQADRFVDVAEDLIDSETDPAVKASATGLAIDAVEGHIEYRTVQRHVDNFGRVLYRMERVS